MNRRFQGNLKPGLSGTGGSLAIDDNHFFVDNTARDSYFTSNPDEKVTGVFISVGAGYQQWNGTSWVDKTAVVTGPTGSTGADGTDGTDGDDGADGEDAFVYIAYASDSSGTDFTTSFNIDLNYIAIKSTDTEIVSPQASDFAGLWKNYKGVKGDDGADGAGISWKGAWDSGVTYIADDAVEYNGSSYVANAEALNKEPGVDTEWDLWVEKGETGETGEAGADGKTILNGDGVPASGIGVDGDFYIDTTNDDIYGPKTSGAWGAGTSLIGPAGEAGVDGDDGEVNLTTTWNAVLSDTEAPSEKLVNDSVCLHHGVESIGAVSFDNATHVLSVATGMTYWYKGKEIVTGALTCDLDLEADRDHASATLTDRTLYFLYFKDATGKLYWSPTFWDLKEAVPVATVYWNGTAGATSIEAHNHTRDIDWHINAHLTIGARYYSGLDLTKPTVADDATLTIAAGVIYDEDIRHSTAEQTTCRVFYLAAAGSYTFADYSLPYPGTSGDPQYLDTDTYTLTSVEDNKYVCYWVYDTTDKDRPIYIIPSAISATYGTVSAARLETPPSLAGYGLTPEMKLIYRFIYKGDGSFIESTDYRTSASLPSGFIASTTAGSVTFSPAGNIAATNVQGAIEELDSEKQTAGESVTVGSGKTLDVCAGTLTLAADQIQGTSINSYMGKNAIINGGFNIWQRRTSFAAITVNTYHADRFLYSKVGDMVHTVSQDTDVPTQAESGHKSNYSLNVDCTTIDSSIAAGDVCLLGHRIEGYNFAPFVGRQATLSFWVKATKVGIYCIQTSNSTGDRSHISEYTVSTTNTWEKKTVTLTFDYSGGTWNYTTGVGLKVFWILACGSNGQNTPNTWHTGNYAATSNQVNACDSTDNNFWLAQVQLELGPVATDFESRHYGTELALCQRYYEKSYDMLVAPGTSDEDGSVQMIDPKADGETFVRFAIPKRTAPTMVGYSTTGASAKYRDLTSGADFDITFSDIGETGCHVAFATSGAADELKGFHYTASAEL